MEYIPLLMFAVAFVLLLAGYPVALTLAGTGLAFAAGGIAAGVLAASDLGFIPVRLFDIMSNQTLIAVPLFILMGSLLTQARIGDELVGNLSKLFGHFPCGLGFSVVLVGLLMAASTGIIGATVVTMGLIALPTMLKQGYHPSLATGIICASGTLGQIIPPAIALVLLGDVMGTAYQQAQLSMGVFSPQVTSVGHMLIGALLPGLVLVGLYLLYLLWIAWRNPAMAPPTERQVSDSLPRLLASVLPPLLLIMTVLGSILAGLATPTEAAGLGAAGTLLLALARRRLNVARFTEATRSTLNTTAMVFFILVGASIFTLVFRSYGGDEVIRHLFTQMPGGNWGALFITMGIVFGLGFLLDFIEIIFVVVPIVGPILLAMGFDPVWLGIMFAINLQTSFLTPPFGFALFYLRGVTPPEVATTDIYRGVMPFILLQLGLLGLLVAWPQLATWLPDRLLG